MTVKLWLTLFVSLVFFQRQAFAETVYTTVFNVFESIKSERLFVLSGIDGRVYKTANSEENLKRLSGMVGQLVKLDYSLTGNEAIITNIRAAGPNEVDTRTLDLNHFQYNQLRSFAPTDLQTYENAVKVFNNMLNDGDKNRSQCFKRAHMWSFDMWSKSNIYSEKIFMFYTKRYQILEDFNWWFHVAPMVTAGGVEYVMDGTFMKKPTPVKEWYSWFLHTDKITCPEITTYQEFENNHWNRLCYIMKVPMYYFRPLDMENRDKIGELRNHWVLEELQDARKAFKNWDKSYEGLDTGKKDRKF
jgi:hypothetical protein